MVPVLLKGHSDIGFEGTPADASEITLAAPCDGEGTRGGCTDMVTVTADEEGAVWPVQESRSQALGTNACCHADGKENLTMIGRQAIETNRSFTLEELEQFMRQNWDTDGYNAFFSGRPTPASIERYILLPATERYMVIVYARAAGGLFSRKNKVILSVCDTLEGAKEKLLTSIHTHNAFFAAWQISKTMSTEKERRGPAEDALQKYAEHMRRLLTDAGYTA